MSDYNEQDGQYVWVSNGGCQICQTMEGTYATEPARPHYYCDCEISFVRNSDRENTDNNCRLAEEEISWEGAGAGEHAWDNNDPTFPVVYKFTVTCRNGSSFSADIEIDLDRQEVMDDFEMAYEAGLSEALAELDAEISSRCQPCNEQLVS